MIEPKKIPPKSYKGASLATKAIRAECLTCMGGSAPMVRDCPSCRCKFYPHRFGRGGHKLAAIREFCYECVGGDASTGAGASEVEHCTGTDCHVWSLRFGKKPGDWRERMAPGVAS